jgi:hypothetical protein
MKKNHTFKTRREFIKQGALASSLAFIPLPFSSFKRSTSSTLCESYSPEAMKDMGILDVTQKPYTADPKGKKDSTDAIQKAVNDARDSGLVCFFPEGTYLVSDMISCKQEVIKRDFPTTNAVGTRHYDAILKPMILMGSTKGKRPVIKLSKNAKGYNDPSKPKKVIWIWAQGWFDAPGKDEPEWGAEQGNINFNHFFMNIDIDIRGHAGAIGIRHSGSQGSAMMNSTIFAEGAYCGMNNCCGQGGGTYNMQVIGGDYGIVLDSDSRFPMLTSCTFSHQLKSSVGYIGPRIQVPSMFVGCRFNPKADKAIDISNIESHGGLLLIDCVFELNKPGEIAETRKKENIYIENSFCINSRAIYPEGAQIDSPSNWTFIKQFSSSDKSGIKMINGEQVNDEIFIKTEGVDSPVYKDIHDQHFKNIPSFEDSDAVNVKDFGALGDGITDDTMAFRMAIEKSDKIFIPKGHFKLSGSLKLNENTKLFGISRVFTIIGNIEPDTGTNLRNNPQLQEDAKSFKLTTIDHPKASPGLYFLTIGKDIDWSSGQSTWFLTNGRPRIQGNGGGKFYGFGAMHSPLIFEGIKNPTSFYALNVERVKKDPQSEIRNCSNVKVYYFKVEAGSSQSSNMEDLSDANTPCIISNSDNISVYCMTGVVIKLREDQPMLGVVDSKNIKLIHIKSFQPGVFPQVKEKYGNTDFFVPGDKLGSLYIRK